MTLDELLRSPMNPGRAAAEGVPLDSSGRPVFEHTLDASFGSSRGGSGSSRGSSGGSAVEEDSRYDRGDAAASRKRGTQAGRSPHVPQAALPGTLQRSMHDAALATLQRQRHSPQELSFPAPSRVPYSTPATANATASRSPQAFVADPAAVVARASQLRADIERSSLLFQQLAGDRAAAAGYASPSPGSGRGSSPRHRPAEQRWGHTAAESVPDAAALLTSPSRPSQAYADMAPFDAPFAVRQPASRSPFALPRSSASPPQPYGAAASRRWQYSGGAPQYGSQPSHTLATSSPGGQRASTESDTGRMLQPSIDSVRQPAETQAPGRAAGQSHPPTAAGFRAAAPVWPHPGEVSAAASSPMHTAPAGTGRAGSGASSRAGSGAGSSAAHDGAGIGIDLTAASRTTSAILDGLHESVLLLRAARHPALQGAPYPIVPMAPASLHHHTAGTAPNGITHAAAPRLPVPSGRAAVTRAAPTHSTVTTSASAAAANPAPAAAMRARAAVDRASLLQQLPHNRYAAAAWSGHDVADLAAPLRRPTAAVITLPARSSRNQHAATAAGVRGSSASAASGIGPSASDSSARPGVRQASAAIHPRLQVAAPATSRSASAQAGYWGALPVSASAAAVAPSPFPPANRGTHHDARWSPYSATWSGLPSPQAGWAAYQRHVAVSAQ
jgi:hypothetical protein